MSWGTPSPTDRALAAIQEIEAFKAEFPDAYKVLRAEIRAEGFRPPPRRAVEKLLKRLGRLQQTGVTADDLAVGNAKLPPFEQRKPFAIELGYVLRDHALLLRQFADYYDLETHTTETGRVLTDEDFEALADEAEKGYDVSPPNPEAPA